MIPMQTQVQQQPAWATGAAKRASFGTVVSVELRKFTATPADKILLIAGPIALVLLSILFMVDPFNPVTLRKQLGTVVTTVRLAAILVDVALVKLIASEWHYRSAQPTLLAQPSRLRYALAQGTIAFLAWLLIAGLHILMTYTYFAGVLDDHDAQNLLAIRAGTTIGVCLVGSFLMTLLAVSIAWLIPNTAGAIATYCLISILFVIVQANQDFAGWVDPIEPARQLGGLSAHGPIALATSLVLWLGVAALGIFRAARREAA
ncbi:hypothetical protein QRX50_08325 [Amycolatopsis carbonis]|uniref:Uncharacterized protein n=1 Tax=Amycolatopsis carbonis TaxID=715471 RepID=A0A9Y2MTJ9_9PSEU|nr:hypothetical protein [Amycolatopsis sp. 2-15]WIX80755.1 hypothetical protein QRX50_08325 [Amycolatopsis sp. 2-15]